MHHRLTVSLHAAPGALVRILSLVERRGFTIGRLRLEPTGVEDLVELDLGVHTADRSAENLRRQIAKLVDVDEVRLG